MKLNKKQLPFYAAAVQTIQYAVAGYLLLGWIGAFSVGTMGALVSLSMAYASSQVSAEMAKSRKAQSYAALMGLMLLSPVIVGTATFYSLDIVTNPIWRAIVAGVWGIIPDGAVALAGFVAGKGMMDEPKKKPQKSAGAKPAKTTKSLSEFTCRYAGAGCGRKFASQNSANAHARSCGYKPTIAMPIDVSNKIEK